VGVFCTRSPHRPNPVGLTLLRLEGVDTALGALRVSGLDLVDGTPIIIKPYCTREWLPVVEPTFATGAPVLWCVVMLALTRVWVNCVAPPQPSMRFQMRSAQSG